MNRPLLPATPSWAFGLLGAVTAALAGVALWQLQPSSRPDAGPLPMLGELAGAVEPRTPQDVAQLRAYARRRLTISPVDPGAWMTLAYAARGEEGRCGPRCVQALAMAYRVAPLDPVTFPWRARFALENWVDLKPELRDLTIRHMRYAWSTPEGRLAMKDMRLTVRDPSGRLAVQMVAGSLRSEALIKPDS